MPPNALWLMDFKGHVALVRGRLHPLTVVGDHLRYSITLAAAGNKRREGVQKAPRLPPNGTTC